MTSKYVIAMAALFIAIDSCHSVPANQPLSKEIDTIISKEKINAIFNSRDTAYSGKSIACTNYFYTILDKYTVLVLEDTMPIVPDSSVYMKIDSSNSFAVANLYIFKNGNANLYNFCTDETSAPDTESYILTKAYGNVVFKYWSGPEEDGNGPLVSVYIDHLYFTDSTNNSIIPIKNKLIWKVQNWQVYGG